MLTAVSFISYNSEARAQQDMWHIVTPPPLQVTKLRILLNEDYEKCLEYKLVNYILSCKSILSPYTQNTIRISLLYC